MRSHMKRSVAGLMAAGLIFAACGSDDDGGTPATDAPTADTEAPAEEPADTEAPAEEPVDTEAMEEEPVDTEAMEEEPADTEAPAEEPAEEPAGDGEALATEGEVEIAAGTVLNLDECPDDWNPLQGVDGDEIRIGQSLPQSGPLASFGAIGEGMEMYFEYINETDPIDGKDLVLVAKDDAYEAGRTVANVEEMIDSDDIFIIAHLIGTPNNLAARDITAENCVPQVFNSSGFPLWGDPANYPWTVGNILNYETETAIWCSDINERFPDGATVAALIMNNDFGKTYQASLQECEGIEVVAEQLHDPAAPDITNEMTTLIASDADVLIGGTTGAFCPQAAAALAGSTWRPVFYNSYTCNNLSSFYAPVQDAIGTLGDSAPILTNSNKVCGDPAFADDPAILQVEEILNDYGDGTTCADGSFSTGIIYGQFVESILRAAADLPGGLNRVNLMSAVWNSDFTNDLLLGGTLKLDGVNDAYWTESAQLQQVVLGDDGALSFTPVGDVADFEGQSGSYEG